MPKTDIDYSSTIIYKIHCKNPVVKDVYVGHTTNFVQRKHVHKQNCINNTSPNHNYRVYEVIRANGGWNNWQMDIINYFNCADHYAARKKEQEFIIALDATLNSVEPFPKPRVVKTNDVATTGLQHNTEYFCTICNVKFNSTKTHEHHNKTIKHQKLVLVNKKNTENTHKFNCENCNFKCSKKSYWERHIITAKHIKLTKNNTLVSHKEDESLASFICNVCNKLYKSRVGLWKHSKKCKAIELSPEHKPENDIKMLTNLVLEMVKSNSDLQKQMMEVCKNSNMSITNNNNKTFNMQVFLNEKCKDAMNIMDFVNSMTLELSDLEDVGKLGYVEGISNIMIRKLNEMDIYKRPIHCSDAKREIMFVKDDNVWEKENNTYDKLRKAIKKVTYKNSAMLVPWSQKYPACMNNQHHLNDIYVQMMGQAMGGKEEFVDSENKIMKKIAKAVLIDKSC